MPDKQQQTLLDSPDLAFGGGKKTEAQMAAARPTPYAPSGEALGPPSLKERVRRGRLSAPSELTGTQATPSEDAQTAGYSAMALSALVNPMATARGVAGGFTGAIGGGYGGRYLGGIPGRVLHNPQMEKQGAGYGEGIGAATGGLIGSVLGYGGLPLKAKVGGLPIEVGGKPPATPGEPPVLHVPEPTGPPTPPGSAYSVPREQLPGLAQSGRPGAADAYQAAGGRALYTVPEGSTYKPPGIESEPSLASRVRGSRPSLADRIKAGEVMQQGTAASSRATPTSELAPTLWEGVQQPVVDLPGEPSRAGLEYQMGEGQPDESSAIREAQRAKLEKADPNRYKK